MSGAALEESEEGVPPVSGGVGRAAPVLVLLSEEAPTALSVNSDYFPYDPNGPAPLVPT